MHPQVKEAKEPKEKKVKEVKEKKVKKVKDKNAPKRASGAYMFFCQEVRGLLLRVVCIAVQNWVSVWHLH